LLPTTRVAGTSKLDRATIGLCESPQGENRKRRYELRKLLLSTL
jgi:hypothetical protein